MRLDPEKTAAEAAKLAKRAIEAFNGTRMVRLEYRGTSVKTEPMRLVSADGKYWRVLLRLKSGREVEALYSKAKWVATIEEGA